MNIIESKFRQACPDLTDKQLAIITGHTYWGYHVELRENTKVADLLASGWYVYLSTEDYAVIVPKSDALDPREQATRLAEADIPSFSVVYVVPVKRGAYTTREARVLYEMRRDFLLHADVHYRDESQDVFIFWRREELAKRLLEVVEQRLQPTT